MGCRIFGFGEFFDHLNNRVGDQDFWKQFLGEAVLAGFGVGQDHLPRGEGFHLDGELVGLGNVRLSDEFLVGNQLVVEGVEARSNFWAVHVVDGLGTDGDFRAFLGGTASRTLLSDDLHRADEFLGVLGDAEGGRHVVVGHVLDVGHVSIGGEFVGVFLRNTQFHQPFFRCTLYDHFLHPGSPPTLGL